MGQFLIVQGRDPDVVRGLFARGLAAFSTLHGVKPESTGQAAGARVAKFARRLVPGTGLVRDEGVPEWGLAVGTWISDDGGIGGGVLRRVTTALVDDGAALAAAARGLDGYFVFAAGSDRTGDVAVLTDRTGALHAYHASMSGCALVSTSALVLAALTGAEMDDVAVRELLAAHSVFETRSLWRGVEKLPAASVIRLRGGEIVARRRWWSLGDASWGRAAQAASPQDLCDALVGSVESLLGSHPRAVFDLTGGFDSRILVGAALRSGLPFSTVVNGVPDDANVIAANGIAAAFGLDHRNQVPGREFPFPEFSHFQDVCALGDGESNVFDYAPTLLAHTNLSKTFDLAVNGSYGEVCRGYWWDVLGAHLWSRTRFDPRKVAVARFASETWVDRISRGRFDGTVADHFEGVVERTVADLGGLPDVAKVDAVYIRVRMQRWHGRIASLIARLRFNVAPFALRGPLEAALSMTPATRWGGRVPREILVRLDPKLAALPLANGAPATPIRPWNVHRHHAHYAELAGRAGRAARRALRLPVAASAAPTVWRAGDVWRLPELSDLLQPESMLTRDFYDPEALRQLIDSTRAARAAPAATLGRVVTLELAARAVGAARNAVPARA